MPIRLRGVASLTNPAHLAPLLGGLRELLVTPMKGVGFSGATLSRVKVRLADGTSRSLVLKRCNPAADWVANRTNDAIGREAALLAEPSLAAVWEAFECPYVAYAIDAGQAALLMEDLTSGLFPDERRPLVAEHETALLSGIAALHARFWDHRALDRPWLATATGYCDLLAPAILEDPGALAQLPPALAERVVRGWSAAMRLLPDATRDLLTRPSSEIARAWRDLPRTLLHGDTKVANFAVRPSGRVAAFDWAMVGAGPCTIDLGWYLAVNATRLARPKEEVIAHYRSLLEAALGSPIEGELWHRLMDVAILGASRMLLWSKALAHESGTDERRAEWNWWADRIAAIAS